MAETIASGEAAQLRSRPVPHIASRDGLGAGGQLVWDSLTLFADRRYAEANAYLAPGCRMLFPGGREMTDCEEVPVLAAATYRWVKKVFERFDELPGGEKAGTVVYCYGTLYGEWNDGSTFEGVRYIDRFEIAGGKITDQKVWNDLCLALQARAGR